MPDPGISFPKHWPAGDRIYQNLKSQRTNDGVVPFKSRSTYGHNFWHDDGWVAKTRPGDSDYVMAFREKWERLDRVYVWDLEPLRVRAVQKRDARHSLIISGIDDFWFDQDQPDPQLVVMTNLRNGQKRLRVALPLGDVARITEKYGLVVGWLDE